MSIAARLARAEAAIADDRATYVVIDDSGLAPWTPATWPPWRHPEMHPIPEGWPSEGAEPPKADEADAG